MKIEIRNSTPLLRSYRVDRALGLFNVSERQAVEFGFDVEVPVEDEDWRIGVVVGPSGSGKTSIARALIEQGWHEWGTEPWPQAALIDAISPDGDFDAVTGALASVGLGTVPSWIRPYAILSNGEKYRAEMARLIAERPDRVVFDEFTSVLDRDVARVGARAFAKAWRRGPAGRIVFLTPHDDVLAELEPDWIIRTSLEEVAVYGGEDPGRTVSGRDAFDGDVVASVVAR